MIVGLSNGEVIALAGLAVSIIGALFLLAYNAGRHSQRLDTHEKAIADTARTVQGIDRKMNRQSIVLAKIATRQGIDVDEKELVNGSH